MRIAYGVMGYGRGHAMRTSAVLPSLMAEHEVTVFAGGDAYDVLAPRFATVRIPTLGYEYNARGGHSLLRTLSRNAATLGDALFRGPGARALEQELRTRGVQLVISDSETFSHRAAQTLRLPRISFDHIGVIGFCKPHFPPELWMAGLRDAAGYRALMGEPQRVLISSFYPAEPYRASTRIVGPLLREVVLRQQVRRGEHLLAYFNKGEHQFLPHVDAALRQLDLPVLVYGTPFRGQVDNLDFRAPSSEGFAADLAGCRAVISTAGNQLIGEAVHFGKPILALPEAAFEQRLNAHLVERMGVGMRGDLARLTPSMVDHFLGNDRYYRSNMRGHASDGRVEAIRTLHRFIGELGPRGAAGVQRAPSRGRQATRMHPARV